MLLVIKGSYVAPGDESLIVPTGRTPCSVLPSGKKSTLVFSAWSFSPDGKSTLVVARTREGYLRKLHEEENYRISTVSQIKT